MRSRSRRSARVPRKRAVWINIPFGNVSFTETVGNQDLLVAEDWEAQFTGLANEHAVLRAVVGEIHIVQTTAGTAGGDLFWGLYMAGSNETAVPVFTTAGMSEVSWLKTGSLMTTSVVTQSLTAQMQATIPVHVKAKRRLTSADKIAMCAQFGTDAATPAGIFGGLLRFLVARD